MNDLPACTYRGNQVGRGFWQCHCPDLVVPTGIVSSATCRELCPFVARPLSPLPRGGEVKVASPEGERPGPELPLVSCLMPTAGRPQFAAQAIRCFQRQTWSNRELLIVDDGTPGVAELAAADPRIRYFRLGRRLTTGAKRNLACSQAQGDLLIQWDDDDWHGPERIARQVMPILGGQADITGLSDPVFFDLQQWEFWKCSRQTLALYWLEGIFCGTIAFRREIFRRQSIYPDSCLGEDVAFLQAALVARSRLLPVSAGGDYFYVRHGRNTWRCILAYRGSTNRRIQPTRWTAGDWSFYRELHRAC
jgi:glycosyltransferase involved in cell wall biosynthesis